MRRRCRLIKLRNPELNKEISVDTEAKAKIWERSGWLRVEGDAERPVTPRPPQGQASVPAKGGE